MAASNERWLVLAPVLIVFFASVFGSATAGGEFIITHAPSYMTFLQGSNQLANSEISNVIKSVYGFSLSKDLSWDGLAQGSFFEKPKANVVISVVGYDGAPLTIQNTARYPTNDDEPFLNTETVTEHLQRSAVVPIIVDFSVDKTVFDIRSHHPHLFGKLPATFQEVQRVFADGAANFPVKDLGTLNTSSDADLLFLGELHIIQEIIEALKANRQLVNDLSPDFYHFRLRGLSMLVEANGLQSPKVVTAVKLLQTFLAKVTASFKELYGGNVVVEIVTFPKADEASVRIARSLKAEADAAPDESSNSLESDLNVDTAYTGQYPVMFNIILWMMVVLALTVFAVSYGMWYMDPGRDSIIYRMTSQRLKTD
ncbi:Renin receptor [Lamellibrachia satsuma]|nr:Renin receptor [Lamellibrachia satsuma]